MLHDLTVVLQTIEQQRITPCLLYCIAEDVSGCVYYACYSAVQQCSEKLR